jgi:hypothetical protein
MREREISKMITINALIGIMRPFIDKGKDRRPQHVSEE